MANNNNSEDSSKSTERGEDERRGEEYNEETDQSTEDPEMSQRKATIILSTVLSTLVFMTVSLYLGYPGYGLLVLFVALGVFFTLTEE
ncbi:hypothetical protein EGH25_04080 [Haladaptatus sp. F3-133]|uniref:Uncharacterized protein n=1 Tax=Halorutilus salinus TaxID=2487751 RepID=A0A9Q4C270_9EURY|nr:hypothetical protein [Halorutilus salinus]